MDVSDKSLVSTTPQPAKRVGFKQKVATRILGLWGWRLEGQRPAAAKYVLVLYPHTSRQDGPLWILLRCALDVPASVMAKSSLFFPPLGWLLRALGAVPVRRSGEQDQVEVFAEYLRSGKIQVLALSPEGTKALVSEWHTGFYRIAEKAGVPVALAYCDFASKTCGIGPLIHPSGDITADIAQIREFYRGVQGANPAKQSPVQVDK